MASVESVINQNQFHELLQTNNEAIKEAEQTEGQRNQADFMTLMIAQLENQNPLDPQDGAEFLSQLAQFNSVEQLTSLNANVSDLASDMRSSQALQATSLVGRQVRVETPIGLLYSEGGMSGMVDIPQSTNSLQISITDAVGNLVKQLDLQSQAVGEVPFYWDGTDEQGARLPAGVYAVTANADQEGTATNMTTFLDSNVDSVTLGQSTGVVLNVAAVGQVAMEDVKQIQ